MRFLLTYLVFFVGCVADLQAADDMIVIPAGAFAMGTDRGPDDERPRHVVTLGAFAIDRLPVTNARFAAFLSAVGPRNSQGEGLYDVDDPDARIRRHGGEWRADRGYENHPIVEVSWAGARDYCAWLGRRLPTEAEWEKAARGTDGRSYPWGEAPPDATRARFGSGWTATAAVETRPGGASAYGVLDMVGNAWEWVSSAYRPYPYRLLARATTTSGFVVPADPSTRSRAASVRPCRIAHCFGAVLAGRVAPSPAFRGCCGTGTIGGMSCALMRGMDLVCEHPSGRLG